MNKMDYRDIDYTKYEADPNAYQGGYYGNRDTPVALWDLSKASVFLDEDQLKKNIKHLKKNPGKIKNLEEIVKTTLVSAAQKNYPSSNLFPAIISVRKHVMKKKKLNSLIPCFPTHAQLDKMIASRQAQEVKMDASSGARATTDQYLGKAENSEILYTVNLTFCDAIMVVSDQDAKTGHYRTRRMYHLGGGRLIKEQYTKLFAGVAEDAKVIYAHGKDNDQKYAYPETDGIRRGNELSSSVKYKIKSMTKENINLPKSWEEISTNYEPHNEKVNNEAFTFESGSIALYPDGSVSGIARDKL